MTRTAGGKMRAMKAEANGGKSAGRPTGPEGNDDDIQGLAIWIPFAIMGAVGVIAAIID